MRCWYRETRFECGDYLDVALYPVYTKSVIRAKKAKPTSETQQKLNDTLAENKLIRIANANFTEEDIKLDLTYIEDYHPESDEEAARQLSIFLRRVKRYRESQGLEPLKYISVTEKGKRKGRFHHHLIMNGGIDQTELQRIWGKGYIKTAGLVFDENGIATLVGYMLKQAREFMGKKKYSRSRNLIVPQAKSRDNRFSQRQTKELAKDTTDRAQYEMLYEGYFLSQAQVVYNDANGGTYIYARYYKQEAQWCNRKKKSSKQRSSDGQAMHRRSMRN